MMIKKMLLIFLSLMLLVSSVYAQPGQPLLIRPGKTEGISYQTLTDEATDVVLASSGGEIIVLSTGMEWIVTTAISVRVNTFYILNKVR
jgi:hypothetical protein